MKKNLYIFNKSINNDLKLVPLKVRNYVGEVKYLPPVSKEWTNTIYAYNKHNVMNLPVNNNNIQNLIKLYFNMRFVPKFIKRKYKPYWVRRKSINKIYVSNAEIKHTNSKALVTLYTFNREKITLLNKVKFLKKGLLKKIKFFLQNKKFNTQKNRFNIQQDKYFKGKKLTMSLKRELTIFLKRELTILRRFKLRLDLNRYKFEEKLLYRLSNILGMFYNKKLEFNIVNVKSIMFNTDFFTKVLAQKLKKKKINVLRLMNYILNKVTIPKIDTIVKKKSNLKIKKSIDFNLLENKYLNSDLTSILKENNFNTFLNQLYYNIISGDTKHYDKVYDILFNSIKYKNMAGVRLQIKGRLSKRNKADRASVKVKWKGSLKNPYSSYSGLSGVKFRGYLNSNVDYTMLAAKRRVGSFAVKGWISGI